MTGSGACSLIRMLKIKYMENGIFEMNLPSGGTLKVKKEKWYIEYYFSGPDHRYNGKFKYIPDSQIDSFIQAYRTNFDKYQELKKIIPTDGDYSTNGDCGMYIYVCKYGSGISLEHRFYRSKPFPINTIEKLNQLIEDYCKSKIIAETIQQKLELGYSEIELRMRDLQVPEKQPSVLEAQPSASEAQPSAAKEQEANEPLIFPPKQSLFSKLKRLFKGDSRTTT